MLTPFCVHDIVHVCMRQTRWLVAAAINWDKLVDKKLTAPWVPPLKDPFDTSHFDFDEPEGPITPFKGDDSWASAF